MDRREITAKPTLVARGIEATGRERMRKTGRWRQADEDQHTHAHARGKAGAEKEQAGQREVSTGKTLV